MAIQALPETVQSLIRSGITIPSPTQAVEELILNSLDAGASSISVHIDFKYYKIQVTDNGCGISSNQLEAVGDRYMTSKCHSLEDLRGNLKYFGYRGEALAAIREISGILSIISRVKGQNEVFCKLFVQGKSNKAEIYDLQPHDVGTTVTIQDFMFNLPVRRTSIREALEIEEIRACVESIAIIHPQVTFNVHNDSKGTLVFQKHINSDILTSFTHIFGQLTAQSLAPINFSNGKFRISGFIGKYPSRHKNLQFLYVNKRSLRKTKIHTLINNMLAKSSILRGNGPNRFKPIPEAMNAKSLMSFTKLERNKKFAVFIVQIKCDIKDYEISFDPKKTSIFFQDWSSLSNSIELCIRDFLKRENLVLPEVPIAQISKTSANCDALKELEELENETLTEDNISSNGKTFDDFPLTHYLPRAVHGLPAKRKKVKEKSFPVSKNQRRKINPNLSPLDRKRICINEKLEGIYSETTDKDSSYFLSSFKSNSDLETCSERNNNPKCSDQTSMNKSEIINDCLEALVSSEFPFTYSGKKMGNSGDDKINNVRKKGYNRFYNLRKFAANNDIKKKKLTPVNQNKDKQKELTSHYTDDCPPDVSKLDSRNNSVILSNNVDSVDVSFKFSPKVDLQLKEAFGEEQILSQCEIKLNESLGSKKNFIASLKEKSILTADDFIHTLDKEKLTKRCQCKCKNKYTKSLDFDHSTKKFSEVNLPLVGVKFKNTIVSENFQEKEDCILPKGIKDLHDSYFQSKLKCLTKTKNSHFQLKEINKYRTPKNKLDKSSPIITSPYFCYEQGKRIAEAIGKGVNFFINSHCKNKEGQDLTSDYRSSDEHEHEDEEYSPLKNFPCHMESMKNTNFDSYNYKSYHTEMFDNVQFDESRILNSYRNSIINIKDIDSSLCDEENSTNYSSDINKAINFGNTVPNLKNNHQESIIKQVSHKQPTAGGDKIYDSEKDHETESAFVVSQSANSENIEVFLKSHEFIKSPYFTSTQEDNDRLRVNKLVENVTRECVDGMSSDGDRGSSIEDNLKNISDKIHDENEAVINIGESNQNSLIEEKVSCSELYSMEDRFMFLPKGMSPILQYTHCAKKVLSPDVCQKLQLDLLNEEGKDDDIRTVKWQKIFGSECSGSKALIKKLCVEAENGLKRNVNVVKDGYDKKLLKLAEKVSEIMKPFHYTKTIFLNYKM